MLWEAHPNSAQEVKFRQVIQAILKSVNDAVRSIMHVVIESFLVRVVVAAGRGRSENRVLAIINNTQTNTKHINETID